MADELPGVRLETWKPMRVAFFRAVGKEPEHVSLGYLKGWVLRQRFRNPEAVRFFGFDIEVTDAERAKGMRGYEAWASVPASARASEGVRIREVPGGLVAVMRVPDALVDPFGRIPPSWQRFSEWLQRNEEYEFTPGICPEEEICEEGSVHLDLIVRIKPKGRQRHRNAARRGGGRRGIDKAARNQPPAGR